MRTPLAVESLRKVCEVVSLGCTLSSEMQPLNTIVGQGRAVRALQFGLGIKALGFNIFVAGMPGTGRTTTAKQFLENLAASKPVPPDWCYVNNYKDPYRPKAVSMPAGRAGAFQAGMKHFVEEALKEVRRVFDSDQYAARREESIQSFQQQRDALFTAINEKAQQASFFIQATSMGLATVPMKDGKPLQDEEFMALSAEEKETILRRREEIQNELKTVLRQVRNLEKEAGDALQKLDREVALLSLAPLSEDLKEQFPDVPAVLAHLDETMRDILDHLVPFRSDGEEPAQDAPNPQAAQAALAVREALMRKYEVNILVDNSALKGAPVIIELNPTYNNLFGRIEKEAQYGALVTDFTMIRQGSIHRANGGYLVMPAEEMLRNLFSWDSIKRALRNKEIIIEEAAERMGYMTTKSPRPEPVPLNVKIILIGQPQTYYLMHDYDEDFRELFKVKADFDTRMERTPAGVKDYVSFVCAVCEQDGLRHLDATAICKLVEHGSRLTDDQSKLSTRFGELADVMREADYYAGEVGSEHITGEHIKQAIDERFFRSALMQERIREAIAEGVVKIDVDGSQVGQVNGLSVVGMGDVAFGQPSRISVSVGLGSDGVIDIEREAKMSGPIHTKGVLILSGYLAGTFAQDKPINLSARLTFEQNYGGVEGDSASSTELYAILSALSGVPIRQSIAVTGSVNQRGEVQAIGGVNEKIEGFFEVCRAKGLTGQQGVMIPQSNVKNLMLKEDVIEAVRAGQFHVWSVSTIDEGIEVLTGVPAGVRGEDGAFEEGSINARVDQRLRELSSALRQYRKGGDEPETNKPCACSES